MRSSMQELMVLAHTADLWGRQAWEWEVCVMVMWVMGLLGRAR